MSVDFTPFFAEGNEIHPNKVPAGFQAILEKHINAIQQRKIGFLPRSFQGRLWWYGFAPTARQRREVLELLDSWIGPTFSDLPRHRGALETTDPFDAELAAMPLEVLRFEVLPRSKPDSTHSRNEVRNALLTLGDLLRQRPTSEFDADRTTVEVLDDLGHAIAAQDRSVALACLRELEAMADLDQTNLAFLRLRLYAGLQDWNAVLADSDIDQLLAMHRPARITHFIQQAVYATWFAAHDTAGNEQQLLDAVTELPPAFHALYAGTPATSRAQAVVEFLIAVQAGVQETQNRLLDEAGAIEPDLPNHLRAILHLQNPTGAIQPAAPQPPTPTAESPLERATRLMAFGDIQSALDLALTLEPGIPAAYILLTCSRELHSAHRADLVAVYIAAHDLRPLIDSSAPRLRDHLAWLDEFTQSKSHGGWRTWFEDLSHQHATPADPETTDQWTPLSADALTTLLRQASDEVLGRLGEFGGQFMAAHRDIFIVDGAADLSERVLAGLAMGEKNSAGVRVQTLALLDYLLAANPSPQLFASALDWTTLIVKANVSAITVTWAIDVLQTVTATPTAATNPAAVTFFYSVIDTARPFKSALNLTDLEAIKIVAGELAQSFPDDLAAGHTDDADPAAPYRYLQGAKVVLYSLTESATTRAAQVLRSLIPGIDIETSAEHDGSSTLAAQAAHADIFVVVTASAKHAATDFITAKRGTRPIIYVNSRGSSAILRELAEG
ncbi:protein DpdD [Streptomyces sp. NPDC004237]|uniref:protein DpdD n=1 Tax=Streptomyces sp. NPDC004237 TaxID=3154455 RepID=UPI0033A6161D